MHPVDISGRVALLTEKLPHGEDHRRRRSQEVAQRNDIRRLRSVGPILFCWSVTLTDLLLVIEPSLITVTPAQIGNPADKASPYRRLISLIGLAVGAEEPFGQVLLLTDDGAPAINYRFFLSNENVASHYERLAVGLSPTDGLLKRPEFVERHWRPGCAVRAIVVSVDDCDIVHVVLLY